MTYGADQLQVLKGLESVRKRPGMYIGDTDTQSGLQNCFREILDNSCDEVGGGYANKVNVKIGKDGFISIADNGRGIPVDVNKKEGLTGPEIVFTKLHGGGKFDQNSYKVSGGLHGVGAAVVNALSSALICRIARNGREYEIAFKYGECSMPLHEIGKTSEHGTFVTFKPDKSIMKADGLDAKECKQLLKVRSYLHPNATFTFTDERTDEECEFHAPGGISQLVKEKTGQQKTIPEDIISFNSQEDVKGKQIDVTLSFWWTDSYNKPKLYAFTNGIAQGDFGSHVTGFRMGLGKVLKDWMHDNMRKARQFDNEDILEGLIACIQIAMPDPKFSSQTKEKLTSREAQSAVYATCSHEFEKWAELHPKDMKTLILKADDSCNARQAARKARELTRKSNSKGAADMWSSKLASCQSNKPEECELFIVEGDSAGGSAKQGRDRKTQAILPLRGKILNTQKSRDYQVLKSEQIATLVSALGCGIGDEFDESKLRYHKIIIMTDADVDGAHIQTLLMTFFYCHMPQLLRGGYVYIACPPLYSARVKGSKRVQWLTDENARIEYLFKRAKHSVTEMRQLKSQCRQIEHIGDEIGSVELADWLSVYNKGDLPTFLQDKMGGTWSLNGHQLTSINTGIKKIFNISKSDQLPQSSVPPLKTYKDILQTGSTGVEIKRFKGLGEMNPKELKDTTMGEHRHLPRIKLNENDDEIVDTLMGSEVAPRRQFIIDNALNATLDL